MDLQHCLSESIFSECEILLTFVVNIHRRLVLLAFQYLSLCRLWQIVFL